MIHLFITINICTQYLCFFGTKGIKIFGFSGCVRRKASTDGSRTLGIKPNLQLAATAFILDSGVDQKSEFMALEWMLNMRFDD
jgi:hypothetical protein